MEEEAGLLRGLGCAGDPSRNAADGFRLAPQERVKRGGSGLGAGESGSTRHFEDFEPAHHERVGHWWWGARKTGGSGTPGWRRGRRGTVAYTLGFFGAWRSLVARIVRDDEVGGSNPLAPTTFSLRSLVDISTSTQDGIAACRPWSQVSA